MLRGTWSRRQGVSAFIPTFIPTASKKNLHAGKSSRVPSVMMSEDAKFALGF